jgi:hypothetical protein
VSDEPAPALYQYDPADLPDDLETGFYDTLRDIPELSDRKAAYLADRYDNAVTVSWATRHDRETLRDDAQLNPQYLHDLLRENDVFQWYNRQPAKLAEGIPDEHRDYLDRFYPLKTELDDFLEDETGDTT